MKKYMELPAGYTALSEDEMTYTSGGSAVGGVVTVVGVAVLASSYVWGISQAKDWLSVSSNRKGNLFTVLGRASDALSEDMSKSPSNFLRDTVAAGTVIALAPLSAILLILLASPRSVPEASPLFEKTMHRASFWDIVRKGVLLWKTS